MNELKENYLVKSEDIHALKTFMNCLTQDGVAPDKIERAVRYTEISLIPRDAPYVDYDSLKRELSALRRQCDKHLLVRADELLVKIVSGSARPVTMNEELDEHVREPASFYDFDQHVPSKFLGLEGEDTFTLGYTFWDKSNVSPAIVGGGTRKLH